MTITADDANKDKLVFALAFREVGREMWIEVVKDLKTPQYVWDTRTVGDGTHDLKVTASDSPDNPPAAALAAARISEPVIVDNTAPLVQDISAAVEDGTIVVSGRAADPGSRIMSVHYSVDSQEDWIAVPVGDGIADSSCESFAFEIEDCERGAHRIAVRVVDLFENAGYAAVTVTVGK